MPPTFNNNENSAEDYSNDLRQLQTPTEDKAEETLVQEESITKKRSTRELLRLARESAAMKLAALTRRDEPPISQTEESHLIEKSGQKKVLVGSESPAYHSNPPIKQKLIRKLDEKDIIRSAPIDLAISSDCAECGMKMTLLKPFTCARCEQSFCPSHAPPTFNGLTLELRFSDGSWRRVCEACHILVNQKNKPANPKSRSLFGYFSQVRAEFADFREIEASRLQRRLEKLADFNGQNGQSFSQFEKTIVPWQADESSSSCSACKTAFGVLQNRRHHCRLCGRLMCLNCLWPEDIPLPLADGSMQGIKNCKTCHLLLFRPKTLTMSTNQQSMLKLYKTVCTLKSQILETIPKFNELLLRPSPSEQQIHDIWTLRDTLILVSLHLKSTLQELAELAEAECEAKWRVFGANVRRAGNIFLQKHMFTLQILNEQSCEAVEESADSSEDEQMSPISKLAKLKKLLIPETLAEVFSLGLQANDSVVSLGLYDDDGSPICANQEALDLKRSVLKEQISQLTAQINDEDSSIDAKIALKESLDYLQDELQSLSRIKLQKK